MVLYKLKADFRATGVGLPRLPFFWESGRRLRSPCERKKLKEFERPRIYIITRHDTETISFSADHTGGARSHRRVFSRMLDVSGNGLPGLPNEASKQRRPSITFTRRLKQNRLDVTRQCCTSHRPCLRCMMFNLYMYLGKSRVYLSSHKPPPPQLSTD